MGTGEWHNVEELYSIINVKVDTPDLDIIINFDFGDIDAEMQPYKDLVKFYKNRIEEGAKQGAKDIAERNKSMQELAIARNGNIASGTLLNNIEIRKQGSDYEYMMGPNVAHFYPLCIEFGRGDVYPINYKFLHFFTLSGVEVFTKHSSPSRPYPFVQPAFEDMISNAKELIEEAIANATN